MPPHAPGKKTPPPRRPPPTKNPPSPPGRGVGGEGRRNRRSGAKICADVSICAPALYFHSEALNFFHPGGVTAAFAMRWKLAMRVVPLLTSARNTRVTLLQIGRAH